MLKSLNIHFVIQIKQTYSKKAELIQHLFWDQNTLEDAKLTLCNKSKLTFTHDPKDFKFIHHITDGGGCPGVEKRVGGVGWCQLVGTAGVRRGGVGGGDGGREVPSVTAGHGTAPHEVLGTFRTGMWDTSHATFYPSGTGTHTHPRLQKTQTRQKKKHIYF